MRNEFAAAADALLRKLTEGEPRLPGVVAALTDRHGNVFERAAGRRVEGSATAMTVDSIFALYSTTKAITSTAVLQCVEEGLVDLDAPARTYAEELGDAKVIEGFEDDGTPKLRPPRREITTRMLMLHTAGFAYDSFDPTYYRLVREGRQPSFLTARKAALSAPLLFDPGERWQYGINVDWCGQIVERVRGKRLGEVMESLIFQPLGLTDVGFTLTDTMRSRLATMHQREPDETLRPLPDMILPQDPEVEMGGHGLYASVVDYMKFIRMWLNDGRGERGTVLRPETVRTASLNGLGDLKIGPISGVTPISKPFEFFPGMPKSWSYGFMVNDEDAPTGRPAGSLGWSGGTNTYYWIDPRNGIGGFWATQMRPFPDHVSFEGFMQFETAAYRALRGSEPAA